MIKKPGIGPELGKLYSATALSNLSDGMSLVAFPLLAAGYAASPTELGIIIAARTLPWLVLSLPAGAIIDHHNPKRVMVAANVLRSVLLLAVMTMVAAGTMSTGALIVIAGLIGSLEVFFDNSSQSLLPRVVPTEALTAANGHQQSIEIVVNKFIGAPVAGFLMLSHTQLAFLAIGVAYLAAAGVVLLIRLLPEPADEVHAAASRKSLLSEIFIGVQLVWQHPVLRSLALVTGLSNFALQAIEAVFVLFVLEGLGAPPWTFGALMTTAAVGGIAGSLVAARLKERLGEAGCFKLLLVTQPFMVLIVPLSMSIWVVGASLFLLGASASVWGAVAVSFRQEIVPRSVLGRANSFYRLLAWGSLPLGSLAGGAAADAIGYTGNYVLFGVIVALPCVLLPYLTPQRLRWARESRADFFALEYAHD